MRSTSDGEGSADMGGAPKLPESPLKAFEDQYGDPRVAIWRRRTLITSIALLGAFEAGAFAFFMFMGWPPSTSDPEEIVFPFVIGIPDLLLGLVGLQMALGRPPKVGWAAAVGALLAAVCVLGHIWFLEEVGSQDTALAFGIAGLVGDGAVIVLPAFRRTRIARHATAVVVLACVLAPVALMWEAWDEVVNIPGPWEATAIVAVLLVPIVGAVVLLWLLFTQPED